MIFLTIHAHVKKMNQKEFLQTLTSIGEDVRCQTGCISYQIHQDVEDGNSFYLELEWDNNLAMQNYLKSTHFSVTMGAIKTFCLLPKIKVGNLAVVDHKNLLDNKY